MGCDDESMGFIYMYMLLELTIITAVRNLKSPKLISTD